MLINEPFEVKLMQNLTNGIYVLKYRLEIKCVNSKLPGSKYYSG
jgi:hypothetical protein